MNPIQQAIEACEWVQLVFTDDTMAQERDPELWMPKMGEALTSLRSLQKEVEGVELPEPVAEVVTIPMQGGKIGRAIRAIDPQWMVSADGVKLYTADQLRTAVAAAMARGAPGSAAWENSEGWESLAWELCADENGEESCNELIWEGGPVPEPWGERWLKYEDEAKRLIALVQKHVRPAAPTPEATQPTQAEAPSEREAFEDSRVQAVYDLLCDETPPPKGEHWEGFAARRIVAALATQQAGQVERDSEDVIQLLDEVRQHFTRDDDLPDNLLSRIDAAIRAARSSEGGGAPA